jgi:hypothetical protein
MKNKWASLLLPTLCLPCIIFGAEQPQLPAGSVARNVQAVGYGDLDGRPAFKISIREHNERWYLYAGHFWHPGWSVVDVTDPEAPRVVKFVPGPENTFTGQVDLSGNTMITGLEKILPAFTRNRNPSFDEGVLIWDISDPVNPRRLGQYKTGGTGTHRNFYAGGRYMHLAAGVPGYDGNIYVIVDISNPVQPTEVGRWWATGQHIAGGEKPTETDESLRGPFGVSLHGPPYVVGDRAYLPYSSAGMIILDISDVSRPREIGRLDFSPPFHASLGVHGVLPLPEKGLAYVNSEDVSYGKGPLHHASIVDISNPAAPRLLSTLPLPTPPPGASYRDFFEKGGWSGPHNINHLQHNPSVEKQGDLFYIAHFNAGLRIYDVSNSRSPVEVGFFMPPEPTKRYGPLPLGRLVLQTEDVLVDRRGFIYITDKNQGLWVLKYNAGASRATSEP